MGLNHDKYHKYLLQKSKIAITKTTHSRRTKHTIFKEANPWKLKIEAYWAENGKIRRADWENNTNQAYTGQGD